MRFSNVNGAVLLPLLTLASTAASIKFDPESEDSIRAASGQYMHGLMSLYKGNATGAAQQDIGIWPQPHYWWEGGASWGGGIIYSSLTGDQSYVKTLQQALTANYGPANDFILDYRKSQTGNDDQAFWSFAAMSALEYQFPDAKDAPADYLEVAVNSFNNIVGRWDMTSCGGGLKWQIYPENAYGFNYKNSISNGAAFALGARLARYTGNQTYADWAVKIFDWTKKVGLISDQYEVFDGSDDKSNCATVADKTQWTYNNAMFLHGSAFMYDYMKGDSTWKERTSGFLEHAEQLFFKPYDNATDIMYEWACETGESGRHCNLDQQSFKAYLSRFMAKTAIMAPFTKDTITKYLKASAVGAAKSCSGGTDGTTCGSKWYTGAWDGTSGVGQQLSALEVTQSLLMIMKNIMPAKMDSESKPEPTAIVNPKPSSTPAATVVPTPSSQAPAPAPLSTAPSSPSSSTVDAPAPPKSSAPAPAPSVSAPASSVAPVPVKPSADASVSMAPSAQYSTSVKPGGQFGQKSSSTSCAKADGSCTCTPSMTTTVYVPAATSSCSTSVTTTVYVQPPVASDIGSTLIPGPPANSSVPGPSASPSQPLEFQGAAVSVRVTGASIIGGAVLGMLAGLI